MTIYTHQIKKLTALHDSVLVADMSFEQRVSLGGIIVPNDDGKNSGIRPRWGRVYAVGPDQKEITVGQYVCVAHGRWTRGVTVEDDFGQHTIRRVDNEHILLVSDHRPVDDTISDKAV